MFQTSRTRGDAGNRCGNKFQKSKILKFSTQNLDFPDFGRLRSIWSAILYLVLYGVPRPSCRPRGHRGDPGRYIS